MTDGTKTKMDGRNGLRWKAGEIVNIYLRSQIVEPCSQPHMAFVHINNIPKSYKRIIKLLGHVNDGSGAQIVQSRWRIRPDQLPTAVKYKLLNEREIVFEWDKVMPYLKDQLRDKVITDGDL